MWESQLQFVKESFVNQTLEFEEEQTFQLQKWSKQSLMRWTNSL